MLAACSVSTPNGSGTDDTAAIGSNESAAGNRNPTTSGKQVSPEASSTAPDRGEVVVSDAGADDPKSACGLNGTSPKPLTTRALWLASTSLKIGAGVVEGKPISTLWATGAATPPVGATGNTSSVSIGSDLAMASQIQNWAGNNSNLYVDAAGFAGDAWAAKYAPAPTRLTFSAIVETSSVAFSVSSPKKTSATPSNKNAEFVRGVVGRDMFAATLVFDFPNLCAVKEVEDILGYEPFVGSMIDGKLAAGLMAEKHLAEVQANFVKNQVSITIAVVGSRKQASISAALTASECATDNLKACAATIEKLLEEHNKVAFPSAKDIDPTTIADGTNAGYQSARFFTSDVGILF